jgi:hypothetical protein
MKLVLLVIACLLATALAAPLSANQYQFLFSKFVDQYQKQYEMNNFFSKFETFKSNLDLIVAHNAKNLSYKMGVNQFADYTKDEFNQLMGLRTVGAPEFALSQTVQTSNFTAPAVWDNVNVWEENKGLPVKDQGQCGSCWAFASTAPLEDAVFQLTGDHHDFSEQQLVDCAGAYGNNGCNGGLMSNAYEYYRKAAGPCEQKSYPYTARDGACKTCSAVSGFKVTGYKSVARGDDAHVEQILEKKTIVGVALAASSSAFQFYKSGVVHGCTDRGVNHGVTLVGVGNVAGDNFYLIRNSWGQSWGDNGHIRLGAGGECALTTSSFDVYPVIA